MNEIEDAVVLHYEPNPVLPVVTKPDPVTEEEIVDYLLDNFIEGEEVFCLSCRKKDDYYIMEELNAFGTTTHKVIYDTQTKKIESEIIHEPIPDYSTESISSSDGKGDSKSDEGVREGSEPAA